MESMRDFATGRWKYILFQMGVSPDHLDGEHHPCPACGGKDRFRFDDLDGRGTWFCNSCGAGDGIQLVMRMSGQNFAQAARAVETIIRDTGGSVPEREFRTKPDLSLIKGRLNEAWTSAKSPDVAAGYLSARGLAPFGDLKDIRGHAGLPLYVNKVYTGNHPAMLALIRGEAGNPVSIHRTYVMADGVRQKKMMQSSETITGGAIRLRDAVGGRLCVGEGIETTIAGSNLFGGGAWALMNAGNMMEWKIPNDVTELVICADNDRSFTGAEAAFSLARRAAAMKRGVKVEVVMPITEGEDIVDCKDSPLLQDKSKARARMVRYSNEQE